MPLTAVAATRKDRRASLDAAPPRMTHQHFAYLAAVLRDLREQGAAPDAGATQRNEASAAERTMYRLADALARTNPAFSRSRFLSACEPTPAEG